MKTILLVEDDEDHILMVERAFKHANIQHHVQVVNNGEAALDYLVGRAQYANREKHPFPDLIFLDLRMPVQSGHELLHEIRAQAGMSQLPIVVFSHSNRPADIESAYQLGANSFILKPVRFERLAEILPAAVRYWLEINTASVKQPY